MLNKNSSNFIKFNLIKKWNNGSINHDCRTDPRWTLQQRDFWTLPNQIDSRSLIIWSDVPCFAFIKVENFLLKISQRLLSRQRCTTKSAWFNEVNICILFNDIYVTLCQVFLCLLIILYNQGYKESRTYQQDLLHSCIYHPLFTVPFIIFAYTLAKN